MSNPSSFSSAAGSSSMPSPPPRGMPVGDRDLEILYVEQLVHNLCDRQLRVNALLELSKVMEKLEIFLDLAPVLWNSFGTIAVLLQEIISVYPTLSPPTLSTDQSNRICNVLALLQCFASHQDTRIHFLKVDIPHYLYPFLNTITKARPFEYLRLTSLGVIGALVKVDDTEVISYLLRTEIIPLCLLNMKNGSEFSKTVATFIVQKILLNGIGLRYICTKEDRFYAVCSMLQKMVEALAEQPSSRLLKHIICCYLRLSDNQRACEALQESLPHFLTDGTFNNCFRDDPSTRRCIDQLIHNTRRVNRVSARPGGFITSENRP